MNEACKSAAGTRVRRRLSRPTLLTATGLCVLGFAALGVLAQGTGATPPTAGGAAPAAGEAAKAAEVSLQDLFLQSFDFFTVLLLGCSLVAWSIIVICAIEVRKKNILPDESEQVLRRLVKAGSWSELRTFVTQDDSFPSAVVRTCLSQSTDDKDSIREAAELAASEETAKWFRKIEPLNVLGNIGPLLGLAGTVWGMVIAFAALGQAGGQANPANISLGVSKALFHTLLGLLLALPALGVFGFYRGVVDRLCTRAMVVSWELVEGMLTHAPAGRAAASAPAAQRVG
jgi:biopolymer transport protein ExbB